MTSLAIRSATTRITTLLVRAAHNPASAEAVINNELPAALDAFAEAILEQARGSQQFSPPGPPTSAFKK